MASAANAVVVQEPLKQVIKEICQGLETGKEAQFWKGLEDIIGKYASRNRELLNKREEIQDKIDSWHASHKQVHAEELGKSEEYRAFLLKIGYIVPEEAGELSTSSVDPEIGSIAGPQLVCPIDKARFVLKACNARWGSMFDTVFASNILEEKKLAQGANAGWDQARETFAFVNTFLDECFPLTASSWSNVTGITADAGKLTFTLETAKSTATLRSPEAFIGVAKGKACYVLKHNGLHIELVIDKSHKIGALHPAGIADVQFESAVTAILDMEDSVAAVDAEDKVECYRNFAGVMRGDLTVKMDDGKTRSLAKDRGPYTSPSSAEFYLPGKVVSLIRNVGPSMYTDMVTFHGQEVPEHFVDAMVSALCALHDLRRPVKERNSPAGSVYIVKPKMHGPDEVQMVTEMFEDVEKALGLPAMTMKMGVMDEERRTTANLPTCIARAKSRLIFINTGFLDRVGDEIHTSMVLGPFFPKMKIRQQPFLKAYEDHNVLCGIQAKFAGRAQIGKGMWAEPDNMAGMVKAKIGHPKSGANCAWVPSPVGATVHAMHYHQVDVAAVQRGLKHRPREELLRDILSPPIMGEVDAHKMKADEVSQEVDECCQSILGYVVRWVEMGVGCSKVPNMQDVQLMEDRATLRISSQLMANWILHGLITESQVDASLQKMSVIVDKQNEEDSDYVRLGPHFEQSLAFQAAKQLILNGRRAASGLTEPVLHKFRRQAKLAKSKGAAKSAVVAISKY